MSSGCLGEHVGRPFGLGLPAPAIGSMASLATVRGADQPSSSLDPETTSTTRHDLRRVRVVQHHDRRPRQIGAGVGQEIGGWLGHLFWRRRARHGAACASAAVSGLTASPRSGCSSASVGAGRVNPWQTLHAEAYRAAHGPRARCPLGRRGTAREGSLEAMDAFLLRHRIGVPLVV